MLFPPSAHSLSACGPARGTLPPDPLNDRKLLRQNQSHPMNRNAAPAASASRASSVADLLDRRLAVTRGLAVILVLLGLSTIAGWHLHNDTLIRLCVGAVPMAYNTAWGITFLGLSLLTTTFNLRSWSRGLALVPLLLGLVTIFQHLTGISLHLDDWAVPITSDIGAQSPTRVALSAGVAFCLTGTALWFINREVLSEIWFLNLHLLAFLVIGIAVSALVGFAQGITPEQVWGRFNLMAFHTALAFLLANVALLLWLRHRHPPAPSRPRPLVAVAGGMAVFTVALIFSQTLRQEEHQILRQHCADIADLVATSCLQQLKQYDSALQLLAGTWMVSGPLQPAQFESMARLAVERLPQVQAFQWMDPQGVIQWCVPIEGNEVILGQRGDFEPRRRRAMEEARRSNRLTISESVELRQGGTGFIMYLPLTRANRDEGYILGVFRYAALGQPLWSDLATSFDLQLKDMRADGRVVYAAGNPAASPFHSHLQSRDLHYGNAIWRLELVPRREVVVRSLTLLPRLVLGGGAIMGVLTGWLIYLLQAASLNSQALRRTNELLQADMAERQLAEQALREQEAGLRLAQRVANIGSWELNLATQQLAWSDQTYRIFGLSPDRFVPTRDNFYNLVHPEDREPLRQAINALIQEGGSFDREFRALLPNGQERILHEQAAAVIMPHSGTVKLVGVVRDITEMRLAQQEREKLIIELQEALENVKTLSGLLPICANCKKIRDDRGYWNQIEIYLQKHSDARFTHGLCPECVKKLYPELGDLTLPGEKPSPPEA